MTFSALIFNISLLQRSYANSCQPPLICSRLLHPFTSFSPSVDLITFARNKEIWIKSVKSCKVKNYFNKSWLRAHPSSTEWVGSSFASKHLHREVWLLREVLIKAIDCLLHTPWISSFCPVTSAGVRVVTKTYLNIPSFYAFPYQQTERFILLGEEFTLWTHHPIFPLSYIYLIYLRCSYFANWLK